MQTFLPYEDFEESAKCLDNKRLGKQRVENFQILKALLTGKGWIHHPATKQWNGSYMHLFLYHLAVCNEWVSRGFNDSTLDKFSELIQEYADDVKSHIDTYNKPKWLGHEQYHSSHRANLLRKDPEHYGKFGWSEDPSMPYFWPVHHDL